jgi:hypothetical protein
MTRSNKKFSLNNLLATRLEIIKRIDMNVEVRAGNLVSVSSNKSYSINENEAIKLGSRLHDIEDYIFQYAVSSDSEAVAKSKAIFDIFLYQSEIDEPHPYIEAIRTCFADLGKVSLLSRS